MNTTLPANHDLFASFYKGFTHFASLMVYPEMVVFKTATHPGSACDNARKRINELGLPLEAKITSHNSFTVQPLN